MKKEILFERDMLYATEELTDPGSIGLKVLGPDRNAKIPLIIEGKSRHYPEKYLHAILSTIQKDILDRIKIDIKTNAKVYIKCTGRLEKEYGTRYITVIFSGDTYLLKGVDDIEIE